MWVAVRPGPGRFGRSLKCWARPSSSSFVGEDGETGVAPAKGSNSLSTDDAQRVTIGVMLSGSGCWGSVRVWGGSRSRCATSSGYVCRLQRESILRYQLPWLLLVTHEVQCRYC